MKNEVCLMRGLGLSLVLLGLTSVITNIVWLILGPKAFSSISLGFWGGIPVILAGIMAMMASALRKNGLLLLTLAATIVSILADVAVLGLATTAIAVSAERDYAHDARGTFIFGVIFLLVSFTCFCILVTVCVLCAKNLSNYSPSDQEKSFSREITSVPLQSKMATYEPYPAHLQV